VKDLVENALDAGASRVEVDIEDCGISMIRVRDDGHGMLPDDTERAVAEQATSKIRTSGDLARVESLGLRGEALHAIGSVFHLTLTTNAPGAGSPGFRVRVLAGETVEAGPASRRARPWRRASSSSTSPCATAFSGP
jgi:DNA mismatch repair protein MutL